MTRLHALTSALAVALAAAALAVAVLHAAPGPRGPAGPQGPAGPAGATGQQGPAGPAAPALGFTCQMLFPDQSAGGTNTTFYWPCTTNPNG